MEKKIHYFTYPIVALLAALITYFCLRGTPTPIEKPDFIISLEQAKKYYHLYDDRAKLIEDTVKTDGQGKPFVATRSFFLSNEYLDTYMKYVKQRTKELKIAPSGFRLYYGIYPDDYPRGDKLYAKRQNFFIAPTLSVSPKTGRKNEGFTLNNVDGKIDVIPLDSLFEEKDIDPNQTKKENRTGAIDQKTKQVQEASFLNFFTANTIQDDDSLIGNEVNQTPPDFED